jgi:hypothetical protein
MEAYQNDHRPVLRLTRRKEARRFMVQTITIHPIARAAALFHLLLILVPVAVAIPGTEQAGENMRSLRLHRFEEPGSRPRIC